MTNNISSKSAAAAATASSSTSGASRANYDNYGGGTGGSSNSASSSWKQNSSSTHNLPLSMKEESDEDLFTVPDMEAAPQVAEGKMEEKDLTSQNNNKNKNAATTNNQDDQQTTGKRKRGRNPIDREHRRLKRLLRNRVSAQQARERKKVYVSDLESRAAELQDRNSKLEEKISTLVNENTMLRKVLLNTRPKTDESS